MSKEQTFILDYVLSGIVTLIMKDRRLSTPEALEVLYSSRLYEKLNDLDTGLYLQSADYNYEILQDELNAGNHIL